MFEGILLKPAMVTPGADCKVKSNPAQVAEYTLKMLNRRVPPAVPGIMFLSGGQSEMESTLNLNAMNQKPNPWHVSFSYARALQVSGHALLNPGLSYRDVCVLLAADLLHIPLLLQNTVLKTWQGKPENVKISQEALLKRAKANSEAQLGKYDAAGESKEAGKGMYEKGYVYCE